MFDTTIVSGIYINATLIQCITPPHTNATVNVSVSNDLYEWVLLPEQFTYTLMINDTVSMINPPVGWITGGSLITITAANFLNTTQLSCGFDTTSVPATYISSTVIQCITPPHDQGVVSVNVTNDGYEFVELPETFTYTLPINVTVSSLSPIVGWTTGGSLISIQADNFLNTTELSCMFDTSVVSATYVSASNITCLTPIHTNGTVNVSVTNDGYEWVQLPQQFEYTIPIDVSVSSVSPAVGWSTGQSVITVIARNFLNTSELSCMFDTITVAATYINDTTIVCITPAHAVGSVPVSVSNDGYEWAVISMPFNYTLPIMSRF